jgi:hypothetical protein
MTANAVTVGILQAVCIMVFVYCAANLAWSLFVEFYKYMERRKVRRTVRAKYNGELGRESFFRN